MERHNGIELDPEGAFVYYDDAQATVEALQRERDGLEAKCFEEHVTIEQADAKVMKLEGDKGMWANERRDLLTQLENAESQLSQLQALVQALQRELESANALLHKKNCAIGKAETTIQALQRERDEANLYRDQARANQESLAACVDRDVRKIKDLQAALDAEVKMWLITNARPGKDVSAEHAERSSEPHFGCAAKEATVSEVQRHNGLDADPEGAFVYYDEYCALRDERDRLAELVRQAQPHVCSLLCPSVKARHELWTHTKLCLNMQAALTPAGGGQEHANDSHIG